MITKKQYETAKKIIEQYEHEQTSDRAVIEKIVKATLECYNDEEFWEPYLAGKKANIDKIVKHISSADFYLKKESC